MSSRLRVVCAFLFAAAAMNSTADPDERTGEQVFQQACFVCHGTGWNDAPMIGDAYAWEPRVAKGREVLLANTLDGMNNMPARGACANCSDIEIEAAVDYLLSQ